MVDIFVDELDLGALGCEGVDPGATGRPAYHPAVLLKIYIYGYLNWIQSSCRLELEAEAQRRVDVAKGRLAPNFKTIAGFRKDNGKAIRNVCRQFVDPCRLDRGRSLNQFPTVGKPCSVRYSSSQRLGSSASSAHSLTASECNLTIRRARQ